MKLLLIIITLITTPLTFAKDAEYRENTHNFLAGNYLIIGKYYESNKTYHGKATIIVNGDSLKITKFINNKKINATGKIEPAIGADSNVK